MAAASLWSAFHLPSYTPTAYKLTISKLIVELIVIFKSVATLWTVVLVLGGR
jgi:hypothetical protein